MVRQARLIVGLGNPGKDYEFTRHNLGFLVVLRLAQIEGLKLARSAALQAMVAEKKTEERFFLLLPFTFMNNSGIAVRQAVSRKNILLEDVLVVCDDLNLDFGQLRLRGEGSAGGHNGLQSVKEHLRSEGFARLRCGIGRPASKEDVTDYVLSEFSKQEKHQVDEFVQRAAECCLGWLKEGTSHKVMSQFNKRKEDE